VNVKEFDSYNEIVIVMLVLLNCETVILHKNLPMLE
jgi:hypothetical protein